MTQQTSVTLEKMLAIFLKSYQEITSLQNLQRIASYLNHRKTSNLSLGLNQR